MKKRFTDEQIIGVLKEAAAGAKVAELLRRHGISEATFYNWKAKYGGMEVSDARRLRELEGENNRLKKLLAEAELSRRSRSCWRESGKPAGKARGGLDPDGRAPDGCDARLRADWDLQIAVSVCAQARCQ